MAKPADRHPENAEGDWFIDRRCIGCGASWSVAPELVAPSSDGTFVIARQPREAAEVKLAQIAAELCPTRSIGTRTRQRWDRHHPMALTEGIWRCGNNAWASAGSNSYLVQRSDGNILVDAPRWNARLARTLTDLGGIATIFITHADDVADAQRYAEHFDAPVWIHERDHNAAPFATHIGTGDEPAELAPGASTIPTPGHTKGHVMLLIDNTILFTGDSLSWDPTREGLWAEQAVCWHSWPQQLDSLERLLNYSFEQIIPSHGALSPRMTPEIMHERLAALLAELRS